MSEQPKISGSKYDLVLGVRTEHSWILLSVLRGNATERERRTAETLLSELAVHPATAPEPIAPVGDAGSAGVVDADAKGGGA